MVRGDMRGNLIGADDIFWRIVWMRPDFFENSSRNLNKTTLGFFIQIKLRAPGNSRFWKFQ